MTHFIIGNPNDPVGIHASRDELIAIQNKVYEIEALGKENQCHICGADGPLTEEHIPSKKATSTAQRTALRVDDEETIRTGRVHWNAQFVQRVTRATLCRQCNNNTGTWYNPTYLKFCRVCAAFAVPDNAGKLCRISVNVYRQRVAKQALATIIASSAAGITWKYPHLWRLITEKELPVSLNPLRLWLYLKADQNQRTAGLLGIISGATKRGRMLADVAFWPFGWILAFDDQPIDGATDISRWSTADYQDKERVEIDVPCQWAVSPYPLDFRSPEQLSAVRP